MQLEARKLLAKCSHEISKPECFHLGSAQRLMAKRHIRRPSFGSLAEHWLAVECRLNDSLAGVQLCFREEPGAAVAHRQERLAVDGGIEVKSHQLRIALMEEVVEADVITNLLAELGQPAMKGDDSIEQAITGEAARFEIDAQKAGEEKVRLPRFDRDARGDAIVFQIPAPLVNQMFRDHPSGCER